MKSKASRIIDAVIATDRFSKWLGIERLDERESYCKLKMIIRNEMCNSLGIAHGGICFSLADSAMAFAANSKGYHTVSIDTSISYIKPVKAGDMIVAVAEEKSSTKRIGVYEVKIENEKSELVALFKGTVFIKETEWDV